MVLVGAETLYRVAGEVAAVENVGPGVGVLPFKKLLLHQRPRPY